jgi:SAM-dependent methyltransferase
MHPDLADRLACPSTGAALRLTAADVEEDGHVSRGRLDAASGVSYPIVGGIPRFVAMESYASTFGVQWQRWATTQLDSVNGTRIFRERFERYFGDPARLEGLSVLDAGCGAGAFLDVVAPYAGRLVGVDLSRAVEPAFASARSHPNVDVVQGDLLALPFPDASFDFVFCIGVLQHTPDPPAAFRSLARMVRPGGTLAVWLYERSRYEALKPRHLVRRYSAGLPPEKAMAFVKRWYRVGRPVRRMLRRLPGGRILAKLVPLSELAGYRGGLADKLTPDEVEEWELMDTHDMLITVYDNPQDPDEVARWFHREGMRPHRSPDAEAIAMLATKPAYGRGEAREKTATSAPTLAGT